MSHRLPPLNGLRAFEVTARHLSFTHAGNELYLTRGAVAQLVKKLEATLGLPLFHRRRNRLTLTPAGERYLPHVTDAFRLVSRATEEIAPALKGRVFRLGVAPVLLQRGSRLALALRTPSEGLRLRLLKVDNLTILHDGTADAVLRTSDDPCPSYNIERMSLEHFGMKGIAARLVTQPGLAGCREHTALVRLLQG
jgi:LysR family glycine cleavage system transcriptional activator